MKQAREPAFFGSRDTLWFQMLKLLEKTPPCAGVLGWSPATVRPQMKCFRWSGAVRQSLEDFPGATPLQKFEDVETGLPFGKTCECHQLGVADAKSRSENRSPSGNGLGFLGHRLECFVTKGRKREFRFAHIVPVFGSFPAFRIHFLSRSNKSLMKGEKEVAGEGLPLL